MARQALRARLAKRPVRVMILASVHAVAASFQKHISIPDISARTTPETSVEQASGCGAKTWKYCSRGQTLLSSPAIFAQGRKEGLSDGRRAAPAGALCEIANTNYFDLNNQ